MSLKGDWNESKGKLKQQYAQLTDEDLEYTEGKGDELVGRLQAKLGKGKREITKLLNDL
ncbi:CsbD family protein [Hymenobacter sp. BT178]|uniref:CsbD family protein n=1 Tax=Hymenobacter lucidus TaxID=2880930 RepID=A0ABS8ATM4_9BACT|nr:CsbD family protein [Hymenobacter lucidus]MCB2408407.1 CsbD family protein [Hymenobacter lucidus]